MISLIGTISVLSRLSLSLCGTEKKGCRESVGITVSVLLKLSYFHFAGNGKPYQVMVKSRQADEEVLN